MRGSLHKKFWLILWLTALAAALPGCERSDRGRANADRSDIIVHPGLPSALVRVSLFVTEDVRLATDQAGLSFWDSPAVTCYLALNQGQQCLVTLHNGSWRIESESGTLWGEIPLAQSAALDVWPRSGGFISVGQTDLSSYRGKLRLTAYDDHTIRVVNMLELESYLLGVVGAEAYASWPMPALRAQSIASRSYALWRINQRNGSGDWDLGSTQASQVYRGLAGEADRVTRAVEETRGVVLTYGSGHDQAVLPAYYSSTCGGHTADSRGAFGGSEPSQQPLTGVQCNYCISAAPWRLVRWAPVEIAKEQVSDSLLARYEELVNLGRVVDIRVAKQSYYGRVQELELTGSNGRRETIGAERFRLGITTAEAPLKSSWYRLEDGQDVWRFTDGHGFGHGVGMCQWGCKGMADAGYDSAAILQHYYPTARLTRVY